MKDRISQTAQLNLFQNRRTTLSPQSLIQLICGRRQESSGIPLTLEIGQSKHFSGLASFLFIRMNNHLSVKNKSVKLPFETNK